MLLGSENDLRPTYVYLCIAAVIVTAMMQSPSANYLARKVPEPQANPARKHELRFANRYRMIEKYSTCVLTHDDDKLPVLSGVASIAAGASGY